jgi:hypothetical protein
MVDAWWAGLPATPVDLGDNHVALGLSDARSLLDPEREDLRRAIVAVSDEAFGRPTTAAWRDKFTVDFLGSLSGFYLWSDADGELVGWSSYRATTIRDQRVVYFASTGLLPKWQGVGLVPRLQRAVLAAERSTHPDCRLTLAVRSRNTHAYRLMSSVLAGADVVPGLDGRVPAGCQPVVASVGAWLGVRVDRATSVVTDAYPDDGGGLYGQEPRSRDPVVNALFARLGPADAFLMLAREHQP